MFNLNTPVEELYLVGPARAKLLKKLGISDLSDLLYFFPRFHQDLSQFSPIKEVKPGNFANIKARIVTIKSFRTKVKRFSLTSAVVEDDTDSLSCVWFNQPFLTKVLRPGEEFIFSGKVTWSSGKRQLQNPVYEQVKFEQVHTARLVPIYSLTARLTQKQLRSIIKNYLDKVFIPDPLPENVIFEEKLLDENTAVKSFHFPKDQQQAALAQKRLAFDEIFTTQLRVLQYKKKRETIKAYPIALDSKLSEKISSLPFELTASQKTAVDDIIGDFQRNFPANRLLEGDVGSGKTIIAALAMYAASLSGIQAVLLAPTEVLAQQHYLSLLKLFLNDGLDVGLLTATSCRINGNPVSKGTLTGQLSSGRLKLVIGTHALLQPSVKFEKLGLIIIDEQHRFGVEQRSSLQRIGKAHLISMTATPIPRTLALTLYGDLDITRLKEMPVGRIPIITELVTETERDRVNSFIADQIRSGRQAFVICPLIEESDKLGVKSATEEFERLKKGPFSEFSLGLLHGRMKAAEKESVMNKFKDNQIQILVSTSVVEVGVDVPNASVMLIEGAERFGLAQLHQFRGRVGRSSHKSYCFLFSNETNPSENPRLKAIASSNNGFELAEKDLKIRGSGDLYGTEQSGYGFKIATLSNIDAVQRSKLHADRLLGQDPMLDRHPMLKRIINQKPALHLE
ncbi:MAG: ATP-dependent DNA helicase RecG [Acidobacteriaceae bacterium]